MSNLGQKIKRLRLEKGIKQGELADGIVTPSMISQIESGKAQPSQRVLEEIAKRLGTSVEYFLTDLKSQHEQNHQIRLARQLMENKGYRQAAEILQSIVNQDEQEPSQQVCLDLAECWVALRKYEPAKEIYQKLYERGLQSGDAPLAVLALNKLGVIHHHQSNFAVANWYWEKAFSLIKKCKDIPLPLHGQVCINLGILKYKLGLVSESEYYYLKGYQLLKGTEHFRQLADASLGLGLVYGLKGNFSLAVEYTQDACSLYKSLNLTDLEFQARINLAILKRDNRQYKDCLEILQQCISNHKDDMPKIEFANVMVELARTYVLMATHRASTGEQLLDLGEARQICSDAIQYCPHDSLTYADLCYILGDITRLCGEYSEATSYYRQAIRLFAKYQLIPQLLRVCTILANMQRSLGQHEVAVETYMEMERLIHDMVKRQPSLN
jgi:tetratricopeptide (TPR) repeat protein